MLSLTIYTGKTGTGSYNCWPWYDVETPAGFVPAHWHAPRPTIFRSVDHLMLEEQVAQYIERGPEKGVRIMSVGEALPGPGNYWTLTVWSQQSMMPPRDDDQEDES